MPYAAAPMEILGVLLIVLFVSACVWIVAEAHGAERVEKPRPYRPGDFIE